MLRGVFALGITVVVISGCSVQRKVSHVEAREPAGLRASAVSSALRERIVHQSVIPTSCPKNLRENLPVVAAERVALPPCPERLTHDFTLARPHLTLEEVARMEEFIDGQCRGISGETFDQTLQSLLDNPDAKAASGADGRSPSGVLTDADPRFALHESLLEARRLEEPMDQWTRLNGEFVIPDEPLQFLGQIVARANCRMTNEEVDLSYRTIRSLEELAKIEKEGDPQRARIEHLLAGIYEVIDFKIKEFFRP